MDKVITENHGRPQALQQPIGKPGKAVSKELTLNAAVISHRGCVRDNNEDNFFFEGDLMPDENVNEGTAIRAKVTKDFHLLAICDGMGGLQGGERASSIAIHTMTILNQYFPAASVERAISSYADEASNLILEDSIQLGEEGQEHRQQARFAEEGRG